MTYTEKMPNVTKSQIKQQFMSFFKTPNVDHLAAKMLNTTAHKSIETDREYDKIFKDLLIQLEYNIDDKLLIKGFVVGLLHKIWMHIQFDNFNTYEMH